MSDAGLERQRRVTRRVARREEALAARPAMSPSGPAPDQLRLATWNLNSMRARLPALDRFLTRTRPDVLCLQETKAAAVSDDARRVFDHHGYGVEHVGSNAYNGVAIVARHAIVDVRASGDFDDEALDREPRLISAVVEAPIRLRVASVYVPTAARSTTGTSRSSWRSSRPSRSRPERGSATRTPWSRATSTSPRPTATSSTLTPSSAPPMSRRPSGPRSRAIQGLIAPDGATGTAARPRFHPGRPRRGGLRDDTRIVGRSPRRRRCRVGRRARPRGRCW